MRVLGLALLWFGGTAACSGGGPGTGEAFGPTEACEAYVACLEAASSDVLDLQREVYGEGAECWSSAASALACTEACEAGVLAERTADPAIVECWTEGAPSTVELFAAIGDRFEIVSGEPEASCASVLGIEGELVGSSSSGFDVRVRVGGYLESLPCTLDESAAFSCKGYEAPLEGAFNPRLTRFDMDVEFYYSSCTSIRGRLLN